MRFYAIPYIIINQLKCCRTKIIIHHINDVTKPPRSLNNLLSFKKYFIRIAKLYICMVLVNIRNIFVKYSHCGPIHINKLY